MPGAGTEGSASYGGTVLAGGGGWNGYFGLDSDTRRIVQKHTFVGAAYGCPRSRGNLCRTIRFSASKQFDSCEEAASAALCPMDDLEENGSLSIGAESFADAVLKRAKGQHDGLKATITYEFEAGAKEEI